MGRSFRAPGIALSIAAFLLTTPYSVAQSGAALFKDKCSSCHGIDGSGRTAAGKNIGAMDLHSKAVVEMSDKEMFESIGRGTRHKKYPHTFLFTGLNEEQIRQLVAHIRELQKK